MKSKPNHQAFTVFFIRVVSALMGCFFSCLRVKDSTTTSTSDVVIRKRNRLSTLMLAESRKEEDLENGNFESVDNRQADVDLKELTEEVKFLKAWGTLPETPNEIRETSKVGKCQSSDKDDLEKSFQPPIPAQKCEESVKETVSLRSDEGNNEEQRALPSKGHADQSYKSASNVQGRKSVRFYCDNMSSIQNLSPEIDSETSKDLGAASNCKGLRPDPYPTPPRLNDEMQTPGTVFSAYQDGVVNKKKIRIRSQYVTSVLNPVENLYQWQGMQPEVSELSKLSTELKESFEEAEAGQSLSGKKMNMESNRDSRLKFNLTNQDEGNHSMRQENVLRLRTLEDRPILGLVAAHWNEDEVSQVSPVSWDGNGIPNSTSKYKEDQKVSWHSTPFVERLEKALSEETMIPQRKPVSGSGRSSTETSGPEESDTALSKLQSSVNIKSIASC